MAVKIRLKRMGKMRDPRYRVVIVDSRKKRDGRVIEEVGVYQPTEHPLTSTWFPTGSSTGSAWAHSPLTPLQHC